MTSEIQQKAIRDSEDMASTLRTRPTSSASAPNLPGLGGGSGGGGSAAVRQAGADADSRFATGEIYGKRVGDDMVKQGYVTPWLKRSPK